MRLDLITLNFNSSESTIRLLKSLQEQKDKNFYITVIDNASEEADFESLTMGTITDDVMVPMVIRNKDNLGFSGGNNVGIRKALENGADWVLLLNNDTYVDKDFIAVLRAKLGQLRGIAGMPLIEGDKTAYCGKIEWLKPTLRHIYNPLYVEQLRRNSNYYAIGGAIAIHRDVFTKIGFLDEKYFLYFEDADFSIRAIKAGIPIAFIDEPKASHSVSSTTKKVGRATLLRYHYRNALYFNWLRGPGHIKFLVLPWSFWIIMKQLLKIIFMYRKEQSSAILKGVSDWYTGKMGKIKTGISQ